MPPFLQVRISFFAQGEISRALPQQLQLPVAVLDKIPLGQGRDGEGHQSLALLVHDLAEQVLGLAITEQLELLNTDHG